MCGQSLGDFWCLETWGEGLVELLLGFHSPTIPLEGKGQGMRPEDPIEMDSSEARGNGYWLKRD